jgi:hypothetical protein
MSSRGGIDKERHYGRYMEGEDRMQDLAHKAAAKALDIPVDDMNITTNNNVSGMNWRHLMAGAIGLNGLGAIAVASMFFLSPSDTPQQPPAPVVEPVTKHFKVRFRDQHDKPFDYIPHRSQVDQRPEGK